MSYIRVNWQDSPSEATPINAENLNHMEDGIVTNEGRLDALENAGIVNKFNNRSGNVSPAKGDYDIGQVSPSTGAAVGQIPIVRNDGTEEDPELNFHMEDVPSSGHKIIDQSGTELTQEPNMTFLDSHLSDNSTDESTDIEIIQSVSESDWENVTEDGLYDVDIEGVDIGPASDEYVEVTADGVKTYGALLNELYSLADATKITKDSYIVRDNGGTSFKFEITRIQNNNFAFTMSRVSGNSCSVTTLWINNSSSLVQVIDASTGGTTSSTETSVVLASGTKITLYYGNKYSVIDLQTTANRCLMSDGENVQQKLDNLFKQTTMTPDISVPANGYNFCDYTAPTGYKLISVDMGLNSLAIFCQISKNGGVSRLSFYNAYTNALTLSNPITLTFAKI